MIATNGQGVAPDYNSKTEKDWIDVTPRRGRGRSEKKTYRKAVGDERWIEDDYWLIPKDIRNLKSSYTIHHAAESLGEMGDGVWDEATGRDRLGVNPDTGNMITSGHSGEALRTHLFDVSRGFASGSSGRGEPIPYGQNQNIDYAGENAVLEAEAAANEAKARASAKEEKDVYSEEELEAIGKEEDLRFGEEALPEPVEDPLVVAAAEKAGSYEEFRSKFDKNGKLFCL
jgi:hypothetical protein